MSGASSGPKISSPSVRASCWPRMRPGASGCRAANASAFSRVAKKRRYSQHTAADGPLAAKMIQSTGGYAEDVSDIEVVAGIQELAEAEGIFTETAGGVTTAVGERRFRRAR